MATISEAAVDHLTVADQRIGPPGEREPTRYLCALAHLRPDWRDGVLTGLLSKPYTAVAPHVGVDLGAVLAHCFWAARRELRFGLAMWLWLLGLVLSAVTLDLLFFCIFCVGGLTTALGHRWRTNNILTQRLQQRNFDPNQPIPGWSSRQQKKLSKLLARQPENVVVYKGFSPFAGSGRQFPSWSLHLDISKPKEEAGSKGKAEAFRTLDLYKHVKEAILDLQLPGVSIEDRLYADGRAIRNDPRFVPDPNARPITRADAFLLYSFIDDHATYARHYQCVQVAWWSEELILTIFLRFSQVGRHLSVEASHCLLAPIADEYREVDAIPPLDGWRLLLHVMGAPATAVRTWYHALPIGWHHCHLAYQRFLLRLQQRRARTNRTFNYGADMSLRELTMRSDFSRYFQRQDKQMYFKIVEGRVLDSITEFLDLRNVDASSLSKSYSTIVNSGIFMSGGEIHADSIAAGEGSIVTWSPGQRSSGQDQESVKDVG